MPEPPSIRSFRRRLVRRGAPSSYSTRAVRELHEHWEDLAEESGRQGLTAAEAEAEATKRIGDPVALADEMFETMRAQSLPARFPTVFFGALALVAIIIWWVGLLALMGLATGAMFWDPKTSTGKPPNAERLMLFVDWIRSGSFVGIPLLCCHIAREYFAGWQGALWGCLVAVAHNATHFFEIAGAPGISTVKWGYTFSTAGPRLAPILIPLAVAALFWAWQHRADFHRNNSDDHFTPA